jgi:hypothetical protein
MFLIDDLLCAPGKAILFIFRELANKGLEELLDDESVKRELQELYNLLSSGKISEAEFEGRENCLLERLEQIARLKFQSQGAGAIADTAAFQESGEEADTAPVHHRPIQINAPPAVPVIESQYGSAPSNAPNAPDFTLSADAFETLRSLSQLAAPGGSDATTHEPQSSKPSLSGLAAVADYVQPSYKPMPAAVVAPVSLPPPIQPQPVPVAATPAPSVAATAPKQIQMSDAVDITGTCSAKEDNLFPRRIQMADAVDTAMRTLAITKLKVSSIISASKGDEGWRVAVELVERAAVPDSGDLLGVYEVQLDHDGDVTRYERVRVRRRNDLQST